MPTAKKRIKHQQSHDAVNTPPSRNPELMRRMYSLLRACRKTVAAAKGIEAAIVGSLMGLLPEDSLLMSHGQEFTRFLYAKGRAPEFLDLAPIDPESAELDAVSQIVLACGYVLDRVVHKTPGLVLAFAGTATSLSAVRDTLVFAVTHRLPIVIVVQHELSRLKKSGAVHDLAYELLGTGIASMTVDGSDVMAVYRVTQEAMYRARHEGGPTLIECKTHRKARIQPRLRPWVQGEAIPYMEEQLRARGFWKDSLRKSS